MEDLVPIELAQKEISTPAALAFNLLQTKWSDIVEMEGGDVSSFLLGDSPDGSKPKPHFLKQIVERSSHPPKEGRKRKLETEGVQQKGSLVQYGFLTC
ncbi:hypothetical protein LOK49_LG15G01299 [Camellia lanceoleosa]|uniref:Uncharacterized protein n=1 Tax=Camellia lanceoleosa TaxID=1840588 RepID=A0ACC0F6S3_9ERIC|nr:hypothetical protein LOK49_LG15G01299 [Camellia lanceoleosa]